MSTSNYSPLDPSIHEAGRLKMEAVGRLAGGIAHDFNNLLTVISGCTQLLMEADAPEEERAMLLSDIAEAATRASSLTRQLLAFSRRQTLQPENIDVASHLAGLMSLLKRMAGEHVECVTDVDAECGCARLDVGQFDQVILNLVANARDAMRAGGTLTIAAAPLRLASTCYRGGVAIPAGDYVSIILADSGEGIGQDVLPHIFEPFFTTKKKNGGTGLGLSTVYGIVKQHGGFIFVASQPGSGTQFEILFPRISCPPVSHSPAPVEPVGRRDATILVVEDEPGVAKLTRQILAAEGYNVFEAANGEEALRLLANHGLNIDLVFTDIVMPRMGGRELAAKASREWTHLAFLFTSGYIGDDVHDSRNLPAGIEIVTKPFSRQTLLSKVVRTLDARKVLC